MKISGEFCIVGEISANCDEIVEEAKKITIPDKLPEGKKPAVLINSCEFFLMLEEQREALSQILLGKGDCEILFGRETGDETNFRYFCAVLSGELPETSIDSKFTDKFPQVSRIVDNNPDLISVMSPDLEVLPGHISRGQGIANIKSFIWLLEKYPEIFPVEARQNPEAWLRNYLSMGYRAMHNNWNNAPELETEWNLRYGLISGFDYQSVVKYSSFTPTKDKLSKFNNSNSREIKKIAARYFGRRHDPNKIEEFLLELNRYSKDPEEGDEETYECFTDEEIKLLTLIYILSWQRTDLRFTPLHEESIQVLDREVAERKEQCSIQLTGELLSLFQELEQAIN